MQVDMDYRKNVKITEHDFLDMCFINLTPSGCAQTAMKRNYIFLLLFVLVYTAHIYIHCYVETIFWQCNCIQRKIIYHVALLQLICKILVGFSIVK